MVSRRLCLARLVVILCICFRPLVPLNVQNLLLARAVTVLDGVAEYNGARSRANRKRKRLARAAEKDERQAKRRKTDGGNSEPDAAMSTGTARTASLPIAHPAASPGMEDHTNEPTVDLGPPPAVVRHTYIGINEVTKRLEFQAGAVRRALVVRPGEVAEPPLPPLHPVRVVLVCMNDVDPQLLIAHLPHLVASCNTPRTSAGLLNVKLIPLPKGAEAVLAEATGLRRASVVAFEVGGFDLYL
jgi:ribonuclease P/MRP protein subunit POP3